VENERIVRAQERQEEVKEFILESLLDLQRKNQHELRDNHKGK